MRDTAPDFERFVAEQYRRLAPEARVRLCTEMFDAARALVEAGLAAGLSEHERRRLITERFYGRELAEQVFPRR